MLTLDEAMMAKKVLICLHFNFGSGMLIRLYSNDNCPIPCFEQFPKAVYSCLSFVVLFFFIFLDFACNLVFP